MFLWGAHHWLLSRFDEWGAQECDDGTAFCTAGAHDRRMLHEIDTHAIDTHNNTHNETHLEEHHDTYMIKEYAWSTVANGWGIPTATDISLAWMIAGVIFGAGHPAISFLLLLAVADDGLGLIIIAIFYPNPNHAFQAGWLAMVVLGMGTAYVLRMYVRCKHWWVYVFTAGTMSWLGLLGAALHPALALVFIVPFLPASMDDEEESEDGDESDDEETVITVAAPVDTSSDQMEAQQEMRNHCHALFTSLNKNKSGSLNRSEVADVSEHPVSNRGVAP